MALRVAHFVQRYPPAIGGSESYFARLSRFFVERGDQVTVFTTTADALEAFWRPDAASLHPGCNIQGGIEVRRYPLNLRFRGRRWLLKPLMLLPHRSWQCATLSCNPFSWSMWRDAGRMAKRFDVVHATAFPYAFPILCARRLARRLGVPFLLTPFLHLGDPGNPRDATRRVYTSPALMALARSADVLFAQTPSERDALLKGGVAPEKIVEQGLGVDPAEWTGGKRWETRQAWNATPGDIVIGHLANNSEEKGSVDLLRAAEMLWQQGLDFQLLLAGPQMPNFCRFWQGYRFRERVRCLGRLSDGQKRDFFAAIDVFCLPSRSDSFGLVLLEAWVHCLPNVAYRAGGIADLVRHEHDGLLAPCGDVEALALQLRRIVLQTDLRTKLGLAGAARIARDFRWQDKLERVREACADLINSPSPSPGYAQTC
jgi:glycosyltransferase involved in cell wall biosynthesis